jgi:hypothetical protein
MERPDIPRALELCRQHGLSFDLMQTTFFLGRETLIPASRSELRRWQAQLFIAMQGAALSATRFFRIPANRVVEMGTQVEIYRLQMRNLSGLRTMKIAWMRSSAISSCIAELSPCPSTNHSDGTPLNDTNLKSRGPSLAPWPNEEWLSHSSGIEDASAAGRLPPPSSTPHVGPEQAESAGLVVGRNRRYERWSRR